MQCPIPHFRALRLAKAPSNIVTMLRTFTLIGNPIIGLINELVKLVHNVYHRRTVEMRSSYSSPISEMVHCLIDGVMARPRRPFR